jgi:hypothetical protein
MIIRVNEKNINFQRYAKMRNDKAQTDEQMVVFRAPKSAVKSLDKLAKLIGANRSEVLRRLIPDLSQKRGAQSA